MFDPSIGRWLTPDPIEYEGGDPNLYRALGNGPVNSTDPSGLQDVRLSDSQVEKLLANTTFRSQLAAHLASKIGSWSQLQIESFLSRPDQWKYAIGENGVLMQGITTGFLDTIITDPGLRGTLAAHGVDLSARPSTAGGLATAGIPGLGIESTFQMYPGVDRAGAIADLRGQLIDIYHHTYTIGLPAAFAATAFLGMIRARGLNHVEACSEGEAWALARGLSGISKNDRPTRVIQIRLRGDPSPIAAGQQVIYTNNTTHVGSVQEFVLAPTAAGGPRYIYIIEHTMDGQRHLHLGINPAGITKPLPISAAGGVGRYDNPLRGTPLEHIYIP